MICPIWPTMPLGPAALSVSFAYRSADTGKAQARFIHLKWEGEGIGWETSLSPTLVKGNVGVQLPEDVGQLLLGHDGQLQHWVVVRLEA